MSWTVACFCGTVFESPATYCPTCHTPLPEITSGTTAPEPTLPPEAEAELLQNPEPATRTTAK
jgi:hypothetical protein